MRLKLKAVVVEWDVRLRCTASLESLTKTTDQQNAVLLQASQFGIALVLTS